MSRLWYRLNQRFLIRYRIEYLVAVIAVHVVRAISPDLAWRGARDLGSLLWRGGMRRKVMRANLAIAFPEKTEAQRDEIGEKTMQHFCCMAVDIFLQTRMLTRGNILKKFTFRGWTQDYMNEHGVAGFRRRATRVLFLTAHLGNWELASGFFSLLNIRIDPVFRPPRNPYMADFIRKIRLDVQSTFIEKRGAVNAMMETLEEGGNVGFLFDQEA
ncbi:MAG: hypothetical protein OER88_07295, partial [Planctomycetota bacterium]|nr:hypothetical protein [Planctomycetota bacterium]